MSYTTSRDTIITEARFRSFWREEEKERRRRILDQSSPKLRRSETGNESWRFKNRA